MKKVKLRTTYASPTGCHPAGAVITVPDAEAKELITWGQAEEVMSPPEKKAPPVPEKAEPEKKAEHSPEDAVGHGPRETAEASAPETATSPAEGKRRGKKK